MTQHFKNLLELAYNTGKTDESDEMSYDFGPHRDIFDHIATIPKTHPIFIYHSVFESSINPLLVMTVFEALSTGVQIDNNEIEIGYEFPIEISEEYVKSVLAKWGCRF